MMAESGGKHNEHDDLWRRIFTERVPEVHGERFLMGVIPSNPRCAWCKAPFGGVGGTVLRKVFQRYPSSFNPRLCNVCDHFFRTHPGGAEIGLTLLFADVRGSTRLAQQMSATEFSRLMDRFYSVATQTIVESDGLIEKFVGDELASLYVPGYAGPNHAQKAIRAAQALLMATGHTDPGGPWLPVGVGVHTGTAFVGSVGSAGVAQFTVLGDLPNTTARLASVAAAGEILIADECGDQAQLDLASLESRALDLKGRSETLRVHVLRVSPLQP